MTRPRRRSAACALLPAISASWAEQAGPAPRKAVRRQLVGRGADLAVLEELASGITARGGEAVELRGRPRVGKSASSPSWTDACLSWLADRGLGAPTSELTRTTTAL